MFSNMAKVWSLLPAIHVVRSEVNSALAGTRRHEESLVYSLYA